MLDESYQASLSNLIAGSLSGLLEGRVPQIFIREGPLV